MDFVAIDMENSTIVLFRCVRLVLSNIVMEYALISIIHISFPLLACPETSSVKNTKAH